MVGPSAQSNEPCLEQVRPAYAVQGLGGIEPEESIVIPAPPRPIIPVILAHARIW